MLKAKDFRIEKQDREVGKKQYMYYRIEGDGTINNGTTSQEERYSTKTPPKAEYWYDVSSILPTGLKDRPDEIFHKYLAKNKHIYSINGHRDLFRPQDLPLNVFEQLLVEFGEEKLGIKANNPLKLRDYQKEGAEYLVNFIKNTCKKALFEAMPGYGKTFSFYYSLLEAGTIKKVAIITSLTLVKEAFVKDFNEQNLAAKGCALKVKEDNTEYVYGDWNTAEYKIIAAPKFINSVFKEFIKDPDCLWVQDEAHLGGASKKSTEFYKDKKVLFITGTGNKLYDKVDSNYFFGITDIIAAIKHNPSLRSVFPIPQIMAEEKFAHIDFGMLKNADPADLEALIDDIVSKSLDGSNLLKNGIVKVGGRYSASAKRLWEVARLTHPEIKWYLSADGINSKSADSEGNFLKGPKAIQRFDKDCENEPDKTHILVTQFQGKESYSYYDLFNVFFLCESTSPESFIQTLSRLDRPKKHTHIDTAVFYMYSPFIKVIETLVDDYERECTRKHTPMSKQGLDEYLRIFNVTANVTQIPSVITAEYALSQLSLHSDLTRGCTTEDWTLLTKYFTSIDEKGLSGLFGNVKKTQSSGKGKLPFVTSTTDPDLEKKEQTKLTLELKQRIELIFSRLIAYCKILEFYKAHPECVQKSNIVKQRLKRYKYPENVKQLRNLPLFNLQSLVYNFRDNKTFAELLQKLSDTFMENLLKRLLAYKNTELEELPCAAYSPYSKTKVNDGKINSDSFVEVILPKITVAKNKRICLMRTGINTALLLKKEGFTDITYITDIVAEKVKCDYYGIKNEYVRKVDNKEDWITTFKQITLDYDLLITNPPYKNGGKIIKAAVSHLKSTAEIINLMPLSQYKPSKLFEHVKSFELVSSKLCKATLYKAADIQDNLGIAVLQKAKTGMTWNSLMSLSLNEDLMLYYQWNIDNNKDIHMASGNYKKPEEFNIDLDFVDSSRCYDTAHKHGYFPKSSFGYAFNVKKAGYENIWRSDIGYIHFSTKQAKDNFCKFAYNWADNKWDCLMSKAISGVVASHGSKANFFSIPQIDWNSINKHPLWKTGQYDEAVLDVMGLKWDNNKEKIIIK